jgi:hypothetical protein
MRWASKNFLMTKLGSSCPIVAQYCAQHFA